jgi:hypothetical protein
MNEKRTSSKVAYPKGFSKSKMKNISKQKLDDFVITNQVIKK